MGIIYILKNKTNSKYYVGQTIQKFKNRLGSHKRCGFSLIGRALRKYGVDNFSKILLENVPEEELDYWEIHYIQECNSISPNGYNLDSGGNENKHLHEETKKKLSEASKKNGIIPPSRKGKIPWNKGKEDVYSKETLKKISEGVKNKAIGKIPWNKDLRGENASFYGKYHTEESRKKMSESHIGKIPWNKGKKIGLAF